MLSGHAGYVRTFSAKASSRQARGPRFRYRAHTRRAAKQPTLQWIKHVASPRLQDPYSDSLGDKD